jgi:hypothetical protein
MLLALEAMEPVLQGIFFLVAVILFVIAAFSGYRAYPWHTGLVALGLAFFAFPFMWNAFAAA